MADMKHVVREALLGYIFWALFQALAPMIWFYPLNELEISGYEAYALLVFSPLVLAISPVRQLCQTHAGLSVLRLLSLAALGSFQAPTTLYRLIALAGGCACVMIVFTVSMWADQEYRTQTFWGHMHGLLAFIVSRIWYTSFVPVWWNTSANSAVLAIGAVATLDKIFMGEKMKPDLEKPHSASTRRPNWLLTGVGFGSLLFVTHWVFGEVSLVSRWTVKGFPDTGPDPYPWGACVLLALWFGIELSPCKHVTRSVIWWVIGTMSFAGLYYLNTWKAFTGGIILAVYVMSVWPDMMDRVTACPPVRTVVLALFVWLLATFFSVWTVAYNFVPGGVYTREHTDWLIASIMLSIGAALLIRRPTHAALSCTAFPTVHGVKMPSGKISTVFYIIVLLGLGGFILRYPKQNFSHPTKVDPQADFSAAIWTYHFGYDNKGWPSMEQAAQLLNDTGADVITLLESDASKPFLGNNDLGLWLSERLGMYVDFGPSTRDHTWGNLILSKYPIVKSAHHLLPSPEGELAPAVTATVNMSGHLVDLVVTHMGNDRDVEDRKLQAEVLARHLSTAENPVVFLGYVTSKPGSTNYNHLITKGQVKDIDRTDSDRWCEYIMYRGLIRLGYARISHGGLSDTEVQLAKFRFPENPADFADNDKITTSNKNVDPDIHFNSKFGRYSVGHNWYPDHSFHMSTPKYFVREDA